MAVVDLCFTRRLLFVEIIGLDWTRLLVDLGVVRSVLVSLRFLSQGAG